MPIRFTCPSCGKAWKATDDQAGLSAACKACGETIRIPDPDAPGGEAPPAREGVGLTTVCIIGLCCTVAGLLLGSVMPRYRTSQAVKGELASLREQLSAYEDNGELASLREQLSAYEDKGELASLREQLSAYEDKWQAAHQRADHLAGRLVAEGQKQARQEKTIADLRAVNERQTERLEKIVPALARQKRGAAKASGAPSRATPIRSAYWARWEKNLKLKGIGKLMGAWQGRGDKETQTFSDTQTFSAPGTWTIRYGRFAHIQFGTGSLDMGSLMIIVMRPGSEAPVDTIMVTGKGASGRTIVYPKGTFYLRIMGANCGWTVFAIQFNLPNDRRGARSRIPVQKR